MNLTKFKKEVEEETSIKLEELLRCKYLDSFIYEQNKCIIDIKQFISSQLTTLAKEIIKDIVPEKEWTSDKYEYNGFNNCIDDIIKRGEYLLNS